jgi:UDP-N-acetylmuramate: L-alanyl-gamma-D-glutamyl-meso-diaminopimelate ligase
MKIYILGIGGTFMSGIAQLAKEKGYEVHGCDQKLYHPMDKVLHRASIKVDEGYDEKNLPSNIDIFVIGNVISRGNPLMEYILTKGYRYCSGPDFLYEHILRNKHVIAVSGTHGKTSVSAMTSKIFLDQQPETGYLIAGETKDFPSSSRLGSGDFFVLEADEYDSAFFDKRSKFIHYRPKTLLINNLEFDHADIFNDLSDIQKQYSQLLRTLAADACVIYPNSDLNIEALFEKDFFSKTRTFLLERMT